MELSGDQKRIQMLFSELKLADEISTPVFAAIWNRAQSRTSARVGRLNFSFVATAFVVCLALSGLIWWKVSRPQLRQPNQNFAATVTPGVGPDKNVPEPPRQRTPITQQVIGRNLRAARLAARRKAELLAARQAITRDAMAIANWRSPTATLLNSQNDQLFKSLPQLDESAKELKSFLPNTSK